MSINMYANLSNEETLSIAFSDGYRKDTVRVKFKIRAFVNPIAITLSMKQFEDLMESFSHKATKELVADIKAGKKVETVYHNLYEEKS